MQENKWSLPRTIHIEQWNTAGFCGPALCAFRGRFHAVFADKSGRLWHASTADPSSKAAAPWDLALVHDKNAHLAADDHEKEKRSSITMTPGTGTSAAELEKQLPFSPTAAHPEPLCADVVTLVTLGDKLYAFYRCVLCIVDLS